MNQAPLNTLSEIISSNTSFTESEKDRLNTAIRLLQKQIHQLEFKVERLNDVKDTLSIMVEESVNELERKSKTLSLTNEELSRTMSKLQQYAEDVEVQKRQLEMEKAKSDKLLLDILPREVVDELKTFGRSYARKYENVSVLFADIKGFSTVAAQLSPDELVAHLDDYFRGFDHIMERYNLEKIKTIGDSYMAVSGLFDRRSNHAIAVVQAAWDMQQFVTSFGESKRIQGLPVFQFRIGIHSGPLVAGVIGIKKFTFDVWGDTVNMAARMEQHGEAGRINISQNTYNLIKDQYNCLPRGMVALKNGREMDMFFVEGRCGE